MADGQQQRKKLEGAVQELQAQVSRLEEEAEHLREASQVGCFVGAVWVCGLSIQDKLLPALPAMA